MHHNGLPLVFPFFPPIAAGFFGAHLNRNGGDLSGASSQMAPQVSSKNYQIEEPLPVSITEVLGASLDIVRLLGALVYIPSCCSWEFQIAT